MNCVCVCVDVIQVSFLIPCTFTFVFVSKILILPYQKANEVNGTFAYIFSKCVLFSLLIDFPEIAFELYYEEWTVQPRSPIMFTKISNYIINKWTLGQTNFE